MTRKAFSLAAQAAILFFMGNPAPTAAENRDPCQHIRCSRRGHCITEDTAPKCVCTEGYKADPVNGLACIPEKMETTQPRKAERPHPPVATLRPSSARAPEVISREEYLVRLDQALVTYNAVRAFKHYRLSKGAAASTEGFTRYLEKRFRKKRRAAISMLATGIALNLIALSFTMMVVEEEEFGFFALPIYFVGIPLTIIGPPLLTRNSRRLARLWAFERRTRHEGLTIAFEGVGPMFSRKDKCAGVGARFRF